MIASREELEYYAQPGPLTDPGVFAGMLDGLPEDLAALCEIVQHNLVHIFWAERYGLNLSEPQKQTVNVRSLAEKLALIEDSGTRSLLEGQRLERRQVGNCRDFSLLMAGILRHQGRPARARCGFGRYFMPGHFEDHWVCEYWHPGQERWVMVDAQLDAFQRQVLGIEFDPLDVPHDQFITGGRAWQMCRMGHADPDHFGIFNMRGWWFIWGDVMRDYYALHKVEILPWDGGWGYLTHDLNDPLDGEDVLKGMDRIAGLTANAESSFKEIRSSYESDVLFRIPNDLISIDARYLEKV